MSNTVLRGGEAVRPWSLGPIPARGSRGEAPELPRPVSPEEVLASARGRAEALLDEARRQADELLERARAEAEALREQARVEGREAGRREAEAEWEERRRQLADLVASLDAAYQRFCTEQEPELVRLAIAAGEWLARGQLAEDPERVVALVRAGLERLAQATALTVYLHPEDLDLVRGHPELTRGSAPGGIRLVADPSLERGGCRLRSDRGEIDATLESRVARLQQTLLDAPR